MSLAQGRKKRARLCDGVLCRDNLGQSSRCTCTMFSVMTHWSKVMYFLSFSKSGNSWLAHGPRLC